MLKNRIKGMEKRDLYLLVIDTICKSCGFRNKGSYKLEEDMDIICCGKCGEFLMVPEDITEQDKEDVQKCIQKSLEEPEEDEYGKI